MAGRSTRKKILYRINQIGNCLAGIADYCDQIEDMSEGRPPEVLKYTAALKGVLPLLAQIVMDMGALYRGGLSPSPDLTSEGP